MPEKSIVENRFDPRRTKRLIIHDGRFHTDDMMFTAMALIAAEKYKNQIEVVRTSELPTEYDEFTVVGDIGFGVYDHHADIDEKLAIGAKNNNTELRQSAACGLLYQDIKEILFPGDSETRKVFEALLDIIEHCDNTPDNNTFSDSVNMLAPVDENDSNAHAAKAVGYCRAVILGFIQAHVKEKSGKVWAVPRVCAGIVPGVAEKRDERYWKATPTIKNRYKYVSFGDTTNMKLRAMDTYSLACGVLTQNKRQEWRTEIEKYDLAQLEEMERREREDWPKAVESMEHKTIFLEKYYTYGKHVKDLNALFIVMPSQRNGYTITTLKTNTGKYRFNPDLLMQFEGCSFVANDKRFVFFNTKEQALNAAHTAGITIDRYLKQVGFEAYRDVYGGCNEEYTGNLFQDLISEDIALNMFVRDFVQNPNQLTVDEYRALQIAVIDNPYLIHAFCTRFRSYDEYMAWDFDASVTEIEGLNKDTLLKKNHRGSSWNMGLERFLQSPAGAAVWNKVHPAQE